MKKVGIITICDYQNYGNRLQNYAVQEILKDLGTDPTTIVNSSPRPQFVEKLSYKERITKLLSQNPVNIFTRIISKFNEKINSKKKAELLKEKKVTFKDFTAKFIKETPYTIDHNNIPTDLKDQFDIFVIGSDQIWNPSFRFGSGFDFGVFCRKEQKIAFSPSFGVSQIPEKYLQTYSKMIDEIQHLSSREVTGSKIISELTGRDAKVLVDPTLILSKERWQKISSPHKFKPHKEYILTYFIGEREKISQKWISETAHLKNTEICNLASIDDPYRYSANPSEFIDYINSAKLLCTDSFHGVIFSILMEIPFVIFERKGKSVKMSSRIDTLLEKFNLQNRRFDKILKSGDVFDIDYSHIKDILRSEREKSLQYLREALKQ